MTTTIKTLSNETMDLLELAGIETPEQLEGLQVDDIRLNLYIRLWDYREITRKEINQAVEELKEFYDL